MLGPIQPVPLTGIRLPETPGAAAGAGDFQSVLSSAIGSVERLRGQAGQAVERFLTGESDEVHSVALATQRAELAFEMFLQVRNKVVSAYQEVMQMQI